VLERLFPKRGDKDMRVFILGGTGSIGTALVRDLRARAHDVVALSRSNMSDEKVRSFGATPRRGDLRDPATWIDEAFEHDAIVHVAATFTEDMGEVDNQVVSEFIGAAKAANDKRRLLYTGGCWLYGETGSDIAIEERPFDPLPAFAWMVENAKRLLETPNLSTAIVHPAMVYHPHGGVFAHFFEAAHQGRPIEIWGSPDTRWPIIHRSDLARAYSGLLDRPDLTGHFNVTAEQGVWVGDIARTIARACGNDLPPVITNVEDLIARHGTWAKGPTLDQQMSAAKLSALTGWTPAITDYRKSDLFDI
jgi:nucleoside-diphosphate-sugar epimerase